MGKPSCIALSQFVYLQPFSQGNDGPCSGTTHLCGHLADYENSPSDGLLYAELEVIALYSQKHEGNCTRTECIGSHFNEISTPLIMLVHSYGTGINMRVNWLNKKSSLSKRTNGRGPLRLAR